MMVQDFLNHNKRQKKKQLELKGVLIEALSCFRSVYCLSRKLLADQYDIVSCLHPEVMDQIKDNRSKGYKNHKSQ